MSLADEPHPQEPDERRTIWFNEPDGAYLVAAALRRYADAAVAWNVVLIPTDRGPGLDVPASAVSLRLVQALIRRFGGHLDAAADHEPTTADG